ncbi:UNVERIFIED_ORG: 4-hydroxy-tetrahydrodipicolinate synthase (plasmid) [Roseateles sp. XES5]|nr:4-hydroxy-tetrahydrodipicolinate synthase [Roseateles sp. XES5]
MLDARNLRGIIPALPTLVRPDDTIDVQAVRTHLAYLIERGVDGVLPLGGTGEYGALPRSERIRMASVTVEAVGGKIPVIAGVLDTGYHDALQAAREFADAGVDALLVLTPYYTNPTQAGVRDYFLRYADESPLPILLYEIPYRTRIAIDPVVTHELSRHERIIGMKACNTDMYHFLQIVAGVDDNFTVLSGEDSLFPLHVAAGAKGGIIVTASLIPDAWRRVLDLAAAGNTEAAIAAHRKLIPLLNLIFAETNPGPMKAVMDMIGVSAPHVLAPLKPPANALEARLREELARQLARMG